MSHRTQSLPEASGVRRWIRELRYHESSRQLFGIVLVGIFAALGDPVRWAFYTGLVLIVPGIGVRMWASGFIFKNKELATSGPYAFVRHPLYVGNILLLAGFAIATASWWAPALALALLLFYYPPAVEYEDRKLHGLFGEAWAVWSAETPALLPRLRPYPGNQRASWSFMQSLRSNGEPLIALYLAGCAAWLASRLGS